ncbi:MULTISPECIES: HAMP domain-containing sensor histidine kinase [Actinomadura]|uniref:histidine kinase n=1 Tax=Actinomadura litoris TaxID=2678616 RepID=A0A7K1LAU6_9ACTN|nr:MULTISPECIES: HAMP domain-containing sensor histidine kinase [Actinomadura]MBT2213121.1 HAMP domain-containing histidine kinase [Actinomadura sp. NEAU-AAG7]MUN41549.1 HAMP domain-containing protein [Actinomadura litoris]
MRPRLVATFTVLIVLVVTALAVPLGLAYAAHRANRLLLDRRADATRFAELADRAAREGDRSALVPEVTRYAALYGAAVRIRDRDGTLLAEAGRMDVDDTAATRTALSGRTTEDLPALGPFGPRAVLIAEPAGRDAQLSGAVLLLAPTERARRDIALVWAALALGALAVLGCSTLAARSLARWILRPVTDLDRTAGEIAGGRLDARVDPGVGPAELRRLTSRFNAMADAVSAAMERQRVFVADASHELRTPLAVLSLRLENLLPHLDAAGTPEHEEAMAEIDRLAALVEAMLALARVESGAAAREVDAAAELRPRLAGWREVFAAQGLTLAVELPESCPAHAVPDAVARVADTALDNAHKFVPPGGTVTVTLEEAPEGAVLRVADDGPGLGGAERADAASRFWRSPDHANVPGSGLGLAIAAELAKASGGTLRLLPGSPSGLVVELRLPGPAGPQP